MSLKIAICDDNITDAKYVSGCVDRWARGKGRAVQIEVFSSAEALLFQYEEDKTYDILLLDIEMGETDGVTMAKKIRMGNNRVQIVFTTGYPDYMAEGYEVSALHYLIKPILADKLAEVLDRAAANLDRREKEVLLLADGQRMRVPVSMIMSVEVFSHICVITTHSGQLKVKYSISELERMLGDDLVRCHRSYLVNPRYIKSISKKAVALDDGRIIPVSRSDYQAVNQGFIRCFKGEAL